MNALFRRKIMFMVDLLADLVEVIIEVISESLIDKVFAKFKKKRVDDKKNS